jgi:hypothetical protein
MLVIIFFVHTIATFAIILPINSVNVKNGQVGMNRFSWEKSIASRHTLELAADRNKHPVSHYPASKTASPHTSFLYIYSPVRRP